MSESKTQSDMAQLERELVDEERETSHLNKRLEECRRELAEARADRDSATRSYRAAESCLAAIADDIETVLSVKPRDDQYWRDSAYDWVTALHSALSAPAEPHPGVGGGDDEGHVDVDIARDCLPSAAVESLPEAWENRAKCTPYPMVRRAIESCAADLKAALSAPAEPKEERSFDTRWKP